jgi:hypothetical protein
MFEKLFGGGGGGNGGGGGQANTSVPIPVSRTRLLDDEKCFDGGYGLVLMVDASYSCRCWGTTSRVPGWSTDIRLARSTEVPQTTTEIPPTTEWGTKPTKYMESTTGTPPAQPLTAKYR